MFSINDDEVVQNLTLTAVDADGVPVSTPLTGVTASVDQPNEAVVYPDPNNPGAFVVERIPQANPVAGDVVVNVKLTDGAISATSAVTFAPGAPASAAITGQIAPKPAPFAASIVISPATASVAPGQSQDFTATVLDQTGTPLATQPDVTFTAAAGTFSGDTYTAPASGATTDTVTATAGSITATATVTIAAAP